MAFFTLLLIFYIVLTFSLKKLFIKAGKNGRDAFIPGKNFGVWCHIIGRKPQYALWLLFPIVNIFIFAGMAVDMLRSFNRTTFLDSVLVVLFTPIVFFRSSLNNDQFNGPILHQEAAHQKMLMEALNKSDKISIRKLENDIRFKKGKLREWTESIIFAVFAAAFIRMFLIEAYVIPTSSMEGSLRVGDYLFVSKAHYGIRLPMTFVMLPLLHNRIPFIETESYFSQPSFKYRRLPALGSVKRFDPVVFNYPEGDSVYLKPGRTYSIYDVRRGVDLEGTYPLVVRPIDKMDHYIKRCIGLPGDTIQIKNKKVYIDGKIIQDPKEMQYNCRVSPFEPMPLDEMRDMGVNLNESEPESGRYPLTEEQRSIIMQNVPNAKIEILYAMGDRSLYPHVPSVNNRWTYDNYGPLWIPKKGVTIKLTPENIQLFQRIIQVYEQNKFEAKDGKLFINDVLTDKYTFKQDYFFMMGDNRDASEDSRYWGFVPENHIVGKPLFVFFSKYSDQYFGSMIRWDRIFKRADTY